MHAARLVLGDFPALLKYDEQFLSFVQDLV
jgi:hypothetical protein